MSLVARELDRMGGGRGCLEEVQTKVMKFGRVVCSSRQRREKWCSGLRIRTVWEPGTVIDVDIEVLKQVALYNFVYFYGF